MARRDNDNYGQEQRFPVRARRMERPVQDYGTQRGEQGRPGYGSFGAERGYNQGGYGGLGAYERGYQPRSYDAKLVRPPRGYQRSDDRIREDVCERLMEGPVDVGDVEVTVKDGEVTLMGTVEERWEKRAIEDIAAHVRGVHDVHNRVRVKPPEDRPMAREATRLREERPQEPQGDQPHMGS
ncbi:BON domain-containing protein [Archangium lipolyticum]|uniref:BON domain-containing protein n=1 Tax=Archangium lipolyticum TaxID=2970465 RepID=UPI00214A0F3C|nr:BON domain-containing protein [Archangium lipolyticum]